MISKSKRDEAYEPTPEELERACSEIQNRWSPDMRNKRSVRSTGGWSPPFVRWQDIGPAVQNAAGVD